MGDTEVAEATTERDTADGWKTVCIRNEKFDVAVIGRMSNNEFLISPVSFHRYIRQGPLGKWLDTSGCTRVNGAHRVQQLARILCPSLPCKWIPSERMTQGIRKRKHAKTSTTSCGEGFEMLATPAWLVVYILLTNCTSNRVNMNGTKDQRRRAFHVLTVITKLAGSCTATGLGAVRTFLNKYDKAEDERIGRRMAGSKRSYRPRGC